MFNDFEEECLRVHNEYWRKHGALPLQLDRQWTEQNSSWNQMKHPSGSGYRENIYPSMGQAVSGRSAVDAWYSKIKDYRFGSGFSSATGHFTQVVWKRSLKMGVGLATNCKGWTYVVANYSPPGNLQDQFSANILPPRNYFAEEPLPATPAAAVLPTTEGINEAIENVIEKLGEGPPQPLCDSLVLTVQHPKTCPLKATWLVTVADGSDGAYYSSFEGVKTYVFFDTKCGKKDVAIFQLEFSYNKNSPLKTDEVKKEIREAFLAAQKEEMKTKVFPANSNYQKYVLKTKKLVVWWAKHFLMSTSEIII